MTDIPKMQETEEPLEGARLYLVDYTEYVRTNPDHKIIPYPHMDVPVIMWRDFEVLSLTCQDLIEHVQKLTERIEELEKK